MGEGWWDVECPEDVPPWREAREIGLATGASGLLGPPARCPTSHPLFGCEGSPPKIDYRRKGSLIRTSLLEDLV